MITRFLRRHIAIVFPAVMAVLWALITLQTHGYYDAITWTCYGVSIAAVAFMSYNYVRWVQKLLAGETSMDLMGLISSLPR